MTRTPEPVSALLRSVIRACRRRRWSVKLADSMGTELTGAGVLARSLILRRLLRRHVLPHDARCVGILLPPTAAAVVTNLALTLDRRVVTNLNYTLTSELLNACIAQAGVRHVLTSRRFAEKIPLQLDAEMIFLEDFKAMPTLLDKAIAALQAYALPTSALLRLLGLHRVNADDVLTVVFTSGSMGNPKGAMLTFDNIGSNAAAVDRVIRLRRDDVLIGVLPFFHSFGYTLTLWAALAVDVAAAYHVNPLEAKVVGKLCRERQGTILLATPMFLRTYLRRGEPEDFATLEVVIAGGEKLPRRLCDDFEEVFGIRPVEGYGITETSPLVASNVPPNRAVGEPTKAWREGTVGRPVPGVRARVVDLESGAELGAGQQGRLWVTGPNVMKGYLNQPEATAEVIRDGWYATGDVATVDGDGFIEIVGRESRFAKIGGEMVPHLRIEEELTNLIGTDEEGSPKAVVVSVPEPVKGERLVVVHTPLPQTPDEVRRGLIEAGLPNLFIPSADSFHEVSELPFIGTGKLDLTRIKQIALEAFAGADSV